MFHAHSYAILAIATACTLGPGCSTVREGTSNPDRDVMSHAAAAPERSHDPHARVHEVATAPPECGVCRVYGLSRASVVRIATEGGQGAGVIISASGQVLTNAHVVASAVEVRIEFSDGSAATGAIVRRDEEQDLAVVQLEGPMAWPPIDVRSESPEVGMSVYVIGHPVGLGWTVSQGIISGVRPSAETGGPPLLQTDAAISPGNSGGPVLDEHGRLVGIVQAKLVAPGIDNIAFVIPAATVRSFLDRPDSVGWSRVPSAELYENGLEAIAANRNGEAARLLTAAAALHADDIELFYWLGVAAWNREQGRLAADAYQRAVALDPQGESEWSLYALENLAEVYSRTDHAAEALEAYRQAAGRETRPEWMDRIHNQIAELDLALGEYWPDDSTVYNEAGEIIGGVGPGMMHTNRNFEIARQTNDPKKEERYYRLAIATDPEMYQPYFNLGLALVHQGRYEEAIPWLQRSDEVWKRDADSNPERIDKADAHAFLALCRLELGEVGIAAEHARLAVAADPSNYFAALYAQRAKIAQGQSGEALPVLESLAAENPEHAETLDALSRAYAALGRSEAARATLDRAIDSIPDDHPWLTLLRDRWERD